VPFAIPENVIVITRIANGGTVAMASDLYRHLSVGIIVAVLDRFLPHRLPVPSGGPS
jgi:hypothetical protein